jgi:hypothetical protein
MDGWCGVCFGADARTGAPLLCTLVAPGIAVRLSVGVGQMQIATRLVFDTCAEKCQRCAGILRGSGGGVEGVVWELEGGFCFWESLCGFRW